MQFNRQRIVFGLYLLVVIAIAELVIMHFGLPAWPAFMAMVFFFAEHMDVKKAPHILVGGVFGIACIMLAGPIIGALTPLVGAEPAYLAFVLGIVFAIIVFGEMLPLLFNNYAFMYLTVAGVALRTADPNPLLWMAMVGIGGAALLAGVVGITKVMAMHAGAKPAAASSAH